MSFEIAPDDTYAVSVAGTDETFEKVPAGSAGTTFLNIDSSADRKPTLRLDGQYGVVGNSKTKSLAVITIPVTDSVTDDVRYNTLRIEAKIHPEDKAAVLASLKSFGMNVLNETAYANLWNYGSHDL